MRRCLLALTIAAAACSSSTDIPDTEPTVHGQITQIDAGGRVLIEGDVSKCERYWFSVDEDTKIFEQLAAGGVAKRNRTDLQVGRTARAWANGPIAESCPAQTSAGVILLF